jgi:hypothetical protein
MDFASLKIEDLVFGSNSSSMSFGPSDSLPDFGAAFDGRLYKPYNKRDKLGKLQEFSMT